ncbi:hypothetical protein SCB71_20125 [Herbiconiux sp. KACC 21604]|uniref:hypothetical protein n=1 Tax=unclassified Herbiconiux TaxID=2618217 RepID=UPI0014911C16|nr:hypothetical protein [Herbiconiux sp. SALV-R1]QJU55335.1 hypothetical protein HL652_18055 [Herbiconiux sp. SALV-R1]WPO86504.1 hypothetical protein SCB71_20125 [Herbiconiux sp. KACC 21604]
MVLIAIVACEIAFWVAILGGLAARYLLRRPRLGAGLLLMAPVIDAVLLVLVAIDLLGGATASWQHGIAAIYIGVSVAYGSRMVAWADVRFQHRFAGGPPPEKPTGARYTAKCWRDVLRTLLAVLIAAAILGAIILVVGDPDRTAALSGYFGILTLVFGIDVVWAVSYTIWPKKPEAGLRPAE